MCSPWIIRNGLVNFAKYYFPTCRMGCDAVMSHQIHIFEADFYVLCWNVFHSRESLWSLVVICLVLSTLLVDGMKLIHKQQDDVPCQGGEALVEVNDETRVSDDTGVWRLLHTLVSFDHWDTKCGSGQFRWELKSRGWGKTGHEPATWPAWSWVEPWDPPVSWYRVSDWSLHRLPIQSRAEDPPL